MYQEDNNPKHSSHLCRDYLAKKEKRGSNYKNFSSLSFSKDFSSFFKGDVGRMVWPPESTDLNPIVSIWN